MAEPEATTAQKTVSLFLIFLFLLKKSKKKEFLRKKLVNKSNLIKLLIYS